MSDKDLEIPQPKPAEPTQPAPHPKEHRRATIALWISCIAAFFALLAATGSVWQAVEVRQTRFENHKALDAQAQDVERSRRAAEDSVRMAQRMSEAFARTVTLANDTLKINQQQLKTSLTHLEIDQRPWLEVTNTVHRTPFVELEINNLGKTPAYELDTRCSVMYVPTRPDSPGTRIFISTTAAQKLTGPASISQGMKGAFRYHLLEPQPMTFSTTLSQSETMNFAPLRFDCTLLYTDIFKSHHSLQWCYEFASDGIMNLCGNTASNYLSK